MHPIVQVMLGVYRCMFSIFTSKIEELEIHCHNLSHFKFLVIQVVIFLSYSARYFQVQIAEFKSSNDQNQHLVLKLLKNFKIGAWCEGASEFGPRALGHRSIICSMMILQ